MSSYETSNRPVLEIQSPRLQRRRIWQLVVPDIPHNWMRDVVRPPGAAVGPTTYPARPRSWGRFLDCEQRGCASNLYFRHDDNASIVRHQQYPLHQLGNSSRGRHRPGDLQTRRRRTRPTSASRPHCLGDHAYRRRHILTNAPSTLQYGTAPADTNQL